MPYLRTKDSLIPYQMERSKRARNLRIVWQHHYAKVTAPTQCTNAQVLLFLFKESRWLSRQHKKSNQKNSYPYSWPKEIEQGTSIPYLGTQLTVNITTSNFENVYRKRHQLMVQAKEQSDIETLVIQWLKKQASKFALHWSHQINAAFGLTPNSIVIKSQKSRWGSCGIHDDLFLNWRLICCPKKVFYYVVVHEHCHLKYRNHGKRYWQLVEKVMSDYKENDRWLTKYGHLMS